MLKEGQTVRLSNAQKTGTSGVRSTLLIWYGVRYTLVVEKNSYHFYFFIQGIAQVMKTKYHMEGSVNGHEFTIEGVGTGNPYE